MYVFYLYLCWYLAPIVAVLPRPLPAHMTLSHLRRRKLYIIQHIVDSILPQRVSTQFRVILYVLSQPF